MKAPLGFNRQTDSTAGKIIEKKFPLNLNLKIQNKIYNQSWSQIFPLWRSPEILLFFNGRRWGKSTNIHNIRPLQKKVIKTSTQKILSDPYKL